MTHASRSGVAHFAFESEEDAIITRLIETAEVQRLKAANADVLMPSSYTSDTFLLLRTAKDLDYNPKLIVAQNAGYESRNRINDHVGGRFAAA